jgi:hypothetical protein
MVRLVEVVQTMHKRLATLLVDVDADLRRPGAGHSPDPTFRNCKLDYVNPLDPDAISVGHSRHVTVELYALLEGDKSRCSSASAISGLWLDDLEPY